MAQTAQYIVQDHLNKIIDLLNQAFAEEWLAYYQYWIGAKVAAGPMRADITDEFMEHANEELKHANRLADRIIQLGGTPVLTPEKWIEIAKCGNISYSNLALNYFRIHESNTTKKQAFSGKNEIEGMEVYKFMLKKNYIGYRDVLRARISHIYSVKYGKQHTFYSEETRKEIMKCWKSNRFINIFIYIIHLVQSHTNIKIIKR